MIPILMSNLLAAWQPWAISKANRSEAAHDANFKFAQPSNRAHLEWKGIAAEYK